MTRVVDVKVLEQLRDDWRSGHSSWHALHADALDSIIQSAQDVPEPNGIIEAARALSSWGRHGPTCKGYTGIKPDGRGSDFDRDRCNCGLRALSIALGVYDGRLAAQDVPELRDGEWATLQCERCGTQSKAFVVAQDVPEPTFPELHGKTYTDQDVPRDEVREALRRIVAHAAAVQSGRYGEHTGYSVAAYCIEVGDAALTSTQSRKDEKWSGLALDSENVERMLVECGEPGWDSYGAEPLERAAVDGATAFLRRAQLIPTNDGGCQLEWHEGGFTLELEFDATGEWTGGYVVDRAQKSDYAWPEETTSTQSLPEGVGE